MGSSDPKELKQYRKAFNEFDNFIKKINKETSKNLSFRIYN